MKTLLLQTAGKFTLWSTLGSAVAATLLTAACSSLPEGAAPTVAVLPGGGKDMAQFNVDDIACRDTARGKANTKAPLPVAMGLGDRVEVASTRNSVAVRTAEPTGSVYGGAVADDPSKFTMQQRFDTAYVSCMYTKGHKIPVGEGMSG